MELFAIGCVSTLVAGFTVWTCALAFSGWVDMKVKQEVKRALLSEDYVMYDPSRRFV